MISQVHILKEKNQLAEARQVCETILTKYRESLVASEATRQLRLLKARPASAAPRMHARAGHERAEFAVAPTRAAAGCPAGGCVDSPLEASKDTEETVEGRAADRPPSKTA